MRVARNPMIWTAAAATPIVVCVVFCWRLWTVFFMTSPSMSPVLPGKGECLLVERVSAFSSILPGQLVLIDIPTEEYGLVRTVRQVAAVGGMPWPKALQTLSSGQAPVPKNKILVMAQDGIDSRTLGLLDRSNVVGFIRVVIFRK